jgi:tripartite-type tricarboxylate transporter receptor subunit TctC
MKCLDRKVLSTCAAALSAASFAIPSAAWAQAYPAKPIRMISQFAAGSGGDVLARIVASAMSDVMGQPVVMENQAGAGGAVAAQAVARAAPDGYTILAATPGTQVTRVFLVRNSTFDPIKDFTPITAVGETPTLIIAHPSLPVNSFKELLAYAKANPGKLSYGTSGIGSPHHLSAEQIKMLTGVEMTHVPYKAGAQAMIDVITGQIPLSYSIIAPAMPHIKSGKVKPLVTVRSKRALWLPNIPTVEELVPGFDAPASWTGLFGPANLPQPVLRRLNGDTVKAMNQPEVMKKINEAGFEVIGNSPEEFAALIKRQVELTGRIVKAAGIKPTD